MEASFPVASRVLPIAPGLNMDLKEVVFDTVRRTLQERVGRDVLNIEVEVEPLLDYLVIRLTQRMLAKQADEKRVDDVRVHSEKSTIKAYEHVPANWWSHILVAIVGGVSVPNGYGWRWKVLKHAKLRPITIATHFLTYTTQEYVTRFTRVCPHVHIPDQHFHLRWLFNVNDERYLQGEKS